MEFLLGSILKEILGPQTYGLGISMFEACISFFLNSPSDYGADFLWTCPENPMSGLSTSCHFFATCRLISVQRKAVFKENQMNGTNVQSKAEEKPSSPRETARVAA